MLANIAWWRLKKFLAFMICMGGSVAVILLSGKNSYNSAFLLLGLLLYDVIVCTPFVKKTAYEVLVKDRGDEICITRKKKSFVIRKDAIQNVTLKEIRYGGRWLDTIGERLVVEADKKYVFDSVCMDENTRRENQDLKELMRLLSQRGDQGLDG